MQKVISQLPELTPYLARIPKNHHLEAVKQLIRIGLEASLSCSCKENALGGSNVIRRQIDSIKQNIQDLNNKFRHQTFNYCRCCQPAFSEPRQSVLQTEPTNRDKAFRERANELTGFQKKNEQKPVKDVGSINFVKNEQGNPFSKQKSFLARHHLDDTGAREALTFPPETLVQNQARARRKSSSFRKHIYQEQVNKEDIGKIKEDKGESLDKLKRDRTISDYSKATSKIKTLIEKDRIRFTQRKREHEFQEGFNKYEYSDENQMEESSMHEEVAKNYQAGLQQPHFAQPNTYDHQSSFKASNQASSSQKSHQKASSKKQFERSKKQVSSQLEGSLGDMRHSYSKQSSQKHEKQSKSGSQKYREEQMEEDDDVVSNSSSFSQFSMEGSRRKQVGKISRRSQND